VTTPSLQNQLVQLFEIIVVPGEEDAPLPDSVGQMDGVVLRYFTSFGRYLDIMPRLAEKGHQDVVGRIVIQIQLHG
jgi:hypothetical protein